MLKKMFEEIQSRLGDEYCLFSEFNPHAFENEEILAKYKNIGVLHINNGNLGKLPDGAMMEINYTLDLFMQVADTVNLSDVIVEPLNDLATGTTGQIMNDAGMFGNFFLNTGLPSSDGAIIEGKGDRNYIRYELPISVVFTSGIALADNKGISITIPGHETQELHSVLSVAEAPTGQVETNMFINALQGDPAMKKESMILGSSWNIQINKLYRENEDGFIRDCILNTPNQVVTITYKNVAHKVVLHDCTIASELGQATVFTINASTAMRGL